MTQMSAEALKLLQETAQKAVQPHVVAELSGDGRRVYVQQGNAVNGFDVPPPCRRHTVGSLESLIAFARRPENKKPIVWYDGESVELVTDDDDRRDRLSFPLTLSDRFSVLLRLDQDPQPMSQQAFIRLLRIKLGLNAAIVSPFRKLDWTNNAGAAADLQHGNLRVGKTIEAKVEGVDQLPEEMRLMLPVYQEPGERTEYAVKCYLDVDTLNQQFSFGPMPDELKRVIDLAQDSIRMRLEAGLAGDPQDERPAIPFYYGKP